MGTKGKEIVGAGAKEIIGLLNKALADEWLAQYQYSDQEKNSRIWSNNNLSLLNKREVQFSEYKNTSS